MPGSPGGALLPEKSDSSLASSSSNKRGNTGLAGGAKDPGGGAADGVSRRGSMMSMNRQGSAGPVAWETTSPGKGDGDTSPLPHEGSGDHELWGGESRASSGASSKAKSKAKKLAPEESVFLSSEEVLRIDKENARWRDMIESFDKRHAGLKKMQQAPYKGKMVGEEEIEGLLGGMMGTPEDVAEAAVRLREIVAGDDAATSALRIKLMARPLAIDTICQSIVESEEVWEVIYAYGVSVRASPNQKSARIGNIPLGNTFAVSTMSSGWLKLKKPPSGMPEGWVRIGPVGKEQVARHTADQGKLAAMNLLMELSQLRHLSFELPRKPELVSTLAFISTIAPAGSDLRNASRRLLDQLRFSQTLLHAWPAAPGRRLGNDRSMHTQSHLRAPELHALRTTKSRRPPTPTGPAGAGHQDREVAGETAVARHARINASQPEGWYGTGIHPIIAPPPVTSLRAYTSGLRLPMTNIEKKIKNPGGPLHVASHVSTFDWAT